MTQLTINPALFIMPALCAFAWMVTRNRTALNISGLSFVAAIVLTVMASNPVLVSDAITKIWHQCSTEMHAGAKTCHVQFGPSEQGQR